MRWLQNIRVCIISTIAILLIVMAISFSVMRAVLPHATGYTEDIQQELSAQLGLPVTIHSLDADMDILTPRLKIIDLIIYKKNGIDKLFHFSEANFSLAYIDSIRHLLPVVGAIDLVGAELFIERHENNRWVVQGYELSGGLVEKNAETNQLVRTIKNINYSLLDSHVHWHDFTHETDDMEFKGVDVKIETFLGNRNLDVKVDLPQQYGDTLQITAELDGDILYHDKLKGKIYIKGQSINLDKWLSKFEVGDGLDVSGLTDVALWIYFDEHKIWKASGELSGTDIEVSNLKRSRITWHAQAIELQFLFRKLSNGWRVDVDNLSVVRNNDEWFHKSQLLFKHTADIENSFSADYLRLQDVIPLAMIFSDIKNNEAFQVLALEELSGDIYNAEVRIGDAKNERFVSATVEDLDFYLKKEKIKGQGIDGTINVENNDIELLFDSTRSRLDFAGTLREAIELDVVTGSIEISSERDALSIRSSDLTAVNADFNLRSRFEMAESNGANHLDMQVDFFDVNAKNLHRYYPVNLLETETINWLDKAIRDGHVEKGGFVFRGNPGAFPFKNSDGVMEVDFAVDNLYLHYLDGWPNLTELDADIRFYNESLTVENGIGNTQDGGVYDVKAVIPDLNNPLLTVTGKAQSDASNVQKFIWNSGLNDLLGNALRQFSMRGGAKLDFYLKAPIGSDDSVKVDGKLNFENARLEYPALNYLFSDINGSLSFTESGMSADNILAKSGKNEVTINVVPVKTPDKHESVIAINGILGADDLLNSFDWIPGDWVSGHSEWATEIHIPHTEEDYRVRVFAQSSLQGVSFNASDGLQKKPSSILPVGIDIFVFDDALLIDVVSQDAFKINAIRDEDNLWAVAVESAIASGTVKFKQGLDTGSTIYANLDSLVLDALASRKSNSKSATLLPKSIPSLEIKVKELQWDDWKFSNVSLITAWQPQGMLIKEYNIEAPSLIMDGQGSWMYSWQHTHESNFKINVSSNNLGSALDSLGIVTGLKDSKLTSTSDWQWQAEPYALSWDKVKGQSAVRLADGAMQDISPGKKGRLLGLFNVLELPKRFSLDFGDVYKDGFAFNTVTADFKLENGNAASDQIEVKAAAADVRMFGRIGMQQQDYDLEVLVKPHSKAASFTGGAILGGPILAAGLVLLQNLFKLDELAYDRYTITGPWDNPITTSISKAKETKVVDVEP